MRQSRGWFLALAVGGSFSATISLRAIDLPGVLPAAADQPQINVDFYLGNNTSPQMVQDTDFFGDPVTVYNDEAYLDTGASGILFDPSTAQYFGIPNSAFNGATVAYNDVGVAGTGNFTVSQPVRIATSNHVFDPNSDIFSVPQPDLSTYTAPSAPMYFQVGPNNNDTSDEVDQIIAGLNAIDVVGMPAMQGKVMVLDPKPVNNFNALDNWDFNSPIPDIFLRTYLYQPGTPYTPNKTASDGTADPGIPTTDHHIKLSYGSFDQFTTTTPTGAPGPTLAHNPFIGENPVDLFEGKPTAPVPGIKITLTTNGITQTSEGNWLLDTGAAASIISQHQAANLGVSYKAGTFGTDTPDLVDSTGHDIPNQFQFQIQGVGGIETLAGFYLDSLLLRTMEGSAANDNDPHNLRFRGAPVLVGDITLTDPVSQMTLTLDGVFGMNFLIASLDPSGLDGLSIPPIATNYFDWITFDEPNGILGLDVHFPGDTNGDGVVDLSDLSTVLNNFGKASLLRTDGNFDGADTIDLTDLSTVLNNFGVNSIGASAVSAGTVAAPEPASLAILLIGVFALATRSQKGLGRPAPASPESDFNAKRPRQQPHFLLQYE
ncbi:MAG TPA: hypothetical protein VM008_19205 [Phycisphaerae bacterium]|nr:hypothetical protein [Phycisphaerae bacterium]